MSQCQELCSLRASTGYFQARQEGLSNLLFLFLFFYLFFIFLYMSTYEERKERSKTSNIRFIWHEPQPIEQEDVNLTFPSTNLIFNFTYFSWIFFFHSFLGGGEL
jgi:hypothetical protein